MDGIISKFPKPVRKIHIILYQICGNDQRFRKKKLLFFTILIILNFFELLKSLFHGIVNENIYRYYLSDFICTFQKHQILFNFSYGATYVYMIRFALKILFDPNQKEIFNTEYLDFLHSDTRKKLIKNHLFRKADADHYLKTIDFFIIYVKFSFRVQCFGVCLGLSRVLYYAYQSLSLESFLLITIPNCLSFIVCFVLNNAIASSVYTLFWLDCIFLSRNLRSLSMSYLCSNREKILKDSSALKNLK